MSSIVCGLKTGLALLAVGTTLAITATVGNAASRFGVVCVKNETSFNVRYRFRVGDGPWETRFMGPGQSRWFSHKYDKLDEKKSPPFVLEYDSDGRSNKNFNVPVKLQRRAAAGQSCEEGSQYSFTHEQANRNFILLVRRS